MSYPPKTMNEQHNIAQDSNPIYAPWIHRWLKPRIDFCEKESTYDAKGLCMLLILFHHIYIKVAYDMGVSVPYIGYILGPGGYLGTGLFFFLSGYGLYHSLSKQTHLSISYLHTRLMKMFCVYVFAFVLSATLNCYTIDCYSLIDFFTLTIPGTTTWFFKVIVVLHIMVYFIFKINVTRKNKVIIISIISLIYYVVAVRYLPDYWYTSVLCFPMGMIVALKKSWFTTYIQIINCFVFIVCLKLIHRMDMLFITAITFCFATLFVIRYIKINSKKLNFIGTNSLCFYLFQLALLKPLMMLLSNPLLYAGLVTITVSLLSYIYVRYIEPRINTYVK